MPELPEVETIKRQLQQDLLGKSIKEVLVNDTRVIKDIGKDKFIKEVQNKKVKEVFRKGKVLIIKLSNDWFLILHLRISGWIIVSDKEERFSRVAFKLSDNKIFNFCDSRVLGHIRLVKDWQTLPLIKTMGPEIFELDKEAFVNLFKNKKTRIKVALLDQKFISGIGNIYAQEGLFSAKINPLEESYKIEPKKLGNLYNSLKDILLKAIAEKGSSVDTYRQVSGEDGNYAKLLKVYNRKGQPCLDCKTTIEWKAIAGRGTCFCPKCQR